MKPEVWAALGSRGTGKSAWVGQQLQRLKPRRLLVWDLMAEHAEHATPAADLAGLLRTLKGKTWRVSFVPAPDPKVREVQFDLVCRGALAAGQCTLLVEELAFVTRAGQAPPGWARVCLLGRHAGVSVIGTSQRPAQVDKDFLGNADLVHVGRLTHEADAKAAAGILGVPWADVMGLPDLHWIERRAGEPQASRGVLSFGAPAASGSKPQARKLRRGQG